VEISIQTSGLHLCNTKMENFREHVRLRIEKTFLRVRRRVTHVSVHFEDVNGPRGGYDKRCVLKVSVGGATATLVQGRDCNLFALINRVSACAADATLKCAKRRVDIARRTKTTDMSADNSPTS
jgi:putative sigma-54 modulation protein